MNPDEREMCRRCDESQIRNRYEDEVEDIESFISDFDLCERCQYEDYQEDIFEMRRGN